MNEKDSWNEAADAWTDFVRDGKDICREYLNTPATLKLIDNVEGKKILDLACGEGYHSRMLAKMGAEVTGTDISERMIQLATEHEKKEPLGIEYHAADAADLTTLADSSFGMVVSFMAFMDFDDLEGATRETARVLKPSGELVFSIVHPCFEHLGEQVSWFGGIVQDDGQIIETDMVPDDYFYRYKFVLKWQMKRIDKPFTTTGFRRPLMDYVNALGNNGLYISQMLEPQPTKEGVEKHPSLEREMKVPLSIIIKAVKQ